MDHATQDITAVDFRAERMRPAWGLEELVGIVALVVVGGIGERGHQLVLHAAFTGEVAIFLPIDCCAGDGQEINVMMIDASRISSHADGSFANRDSFEPPGDDYGGRQDEERYVGWREVMNHRRGHFAIDLDEKRFGVGQQGREDCGEDQDGDPGQSCV